MSVESHEFTVDTNGNNHVVDITRHVIESIQSGQINSGTATVFVVGHRNQIARGALLLVSDLPMTPDGIKTEESDQQVTRDWAQLHLDIGIASLSEIEDKGEKIKHYQY